MKTPIVGTPIRQDAATFTMQEGEAVATYSRQFYRLANEQRYAAEPIALRLVDPLPITLAGGAHLIAVPMRS